MTTGRFAEMHCIGADKFYNEIIEAAGGQNAYSGAAPFPGFRFESVIAMNPGCHRGWRAETGRRHKNLKKAGAISAI